MGKDSKAVSLDYLQSMIDRMAFEMMMSTRFPDCEPKYQEYNAVVAVYNDGIMDLRDRLCEALRELREEAEE